MSKQLKLNHSRLLSLSENLDLPLRINSYLSNRKKHINLFIYLGFYVTFNIVQIISRRVVGRAEETTVRQGSVL